MGSDAPRPKVGLRFAAPADRALQVTSYPLDAAGLVLVLLSTLLWSSNSIAIKFGLTGLPPYSLMAMRTALAGTLLLAVVLWRRLPFPSGRVAWSGAIALGVFQLALSGTLFMWSLQYLPVGRATILSSIQPFLTVIAAHYLFAGERLNLGKLMGLAVGFVGVVVVTLSRGGELGATSVVADAAVLVGAAIATSGNLLVKQIGYRWHTLSLVTVQMLTAAAVMAGVALLFESGAAKVYTPQSIGGLVYLATVGSGGAFFLGFYVIRRYEVGLVSSFVFAQPLFAVALGWVILGEQISWATLLSLALITLGILGVNRSGRRLPRTRP